jgi:hypothetical protein
LIDLQDHYRAWLDNLPASLDGSRLADKLQTIVELDLEELQAIDIPRGYGPRLTESLRHHNHQTRLQQYKEVDNSRSAGAHCRRQDHGGESSCPVMSRSRPTLVLRARQPRDETTVMR